MRGVPRPDLRCSRLACAPAHGAGAPLGLLRRLIPCLVSLLTACDAGPRTFSDVERGKAHLEPSDAAALRGLLAAAGLAPRQLAIDGELGGDSPNWVEVDDAGRVWAIGLAAAPDLDSLAPLAGLAKLSRVRVRGARLTSLEDLGKPESLTLLTIQDSSLESLAGLDGCVGLQVLDLRANALESIAGLAELPELRVLDLADNAIAEVRGLAGRERLESIDLSGNALAGAQGLERLPRLERLNLARNRLTSLDGLSELPRLRVLLADDNRLVDAAAADALPALELINLNGNRLERLPRLVSRMPRHLWQDNPGVR